jgi:hypothetical protein
LCRLLQPVFRDDEHALQPLASGEHVQAGAGAFEATRPT